MPRKPLGKYIESKVCVDYEHLEFRPGNIPARRIRGPPPVLVREIRYSNDPLASGRLVQESRVEETGHLEASGLCLSATEPLRLSGKTESPAHETSKEEKNASADVLSRTEESAGKNEAASAE